MILIREIYSNKVYLYSSPKHKNSKFLNDKLEFHITNKFYKVNSIDNYEVVENANLNIKTEDGINFITIENNWMTGLYDKLDNKNTETATNKIIEPFTTNENPNGMKIQMEMKIMMMEMKIQMKMKMKMKMITKKTEPFLFG